jgi:hypothetical protein
MNGPVFWTTGNLARSAALFSRRPPCNPASSGVTKARRRQLPAGLHFFCATAATWAPSAELPRN